MTRLLICFLLAMSMAWAKPKIYDCFPFFNEIEILKMRLEELNDYVDYFVLVESVETQRGDPKPLYYAENQHLFEKYKDKIIHIVNREMHPDMELWEREHLQRNCIARGLEKCAPEDIILISDVDEIPRPSKLKRLCKLLSRNKRRAVALTQNIYYYQLNRSTATGKTWAGDTWHGTTATTYRHFQKHSAQYFRDRRDRLYAMRDGGWHFTWMGGIDRIRQKHLSVVEGNQEINGVPDKEIASFVERHPPVPVDESFPAYVRENEAYLKSIGFIADVEIGQYTQGN